ncbi:hypothetical protein [Spiroplasma endosymbiont of Othius punctulatus]|uniref:hypothetical protein n=1 Tax=Spiroplasma endosymbiont of Othius punctulatus TaxID=3066289 RepID=UPI0030CD1CA1
MISSIKQYKKGEVSSVQDKLTPNEIYKTQNYGKESLDLIFDYELNNDYDFKLLISSYSKIELLDNKNIYKKELIKFWEHQFNQKFSNFWNVFYNITKSRIEKENSRNQSPINNWENRLGIEKKLIDPIDFRISLLEKSGMANTNVSRKDIVSSNNDIVENNTLNAMRSPFLTKSAEETHVKNVDSAGNINMSEKSTEINQAPDPHLLEFLYGNDAESKLKKKSIINEKKIEEIQTLADTQRKKKKVKQREAEAKVAEEIIDRLATVNLDDFYTYSKSNSYTHEFFTEEFKNSLKGPSDSEELDKNYFDRPNFLGIDDKQNIVVVHEEDSTKYQLAHELFRREEVSRSPQVILKEKMPIINKSISKNSMNTIDAKKEVLKELKQEVEYKRQLHKLNIKNSKIIKLRNEQSAREEEKLQEQRTKLKNKSIKEYNKISSIENEIQLDKLISKKSGLTGKKKSKLKQETHEKTTIFEQIEIFEIDSQLIETQNAIADIDKNINQK